jgi:hypothetical protein
MSSHWLSIFLSALASGLLSLVISHAYYRITTRSSAEHHDAQMRAAEERHTAQMEQMEKHHAEQVLVLRTTLLAVEKDSGVQAARDPEGNLTGGVHHDGEFTAVPEVSASVIESRSGDGKQSKDESETEKSGPGPASRDRHS